MMHFTRTIVVFLSAVIISASQDAFADVGSRHELLIQRTELVSQLSELKSDSLNSSTEETNQLNAELIVLDGLILASYEETMNRLTQQQRRRSSKEQFLALFALVCCAFAFVCVVALYFANIRFRKINGENLLTLYRELFNDFILAVKPDKLGSTALAKIHPVVVIGVICMSISIVVYLVSSFR
jgi:hypothetical protein